MLQLASDLKAAKYAGIETQRLKGKNIALIFEKDSTRTRSAFEVAAFAQGAHVTFIGPTGSHIGYKESMKDTARVLGRMYDGIEYRGFSQENVEILAEYAGVPVWNGLTDEFHPTQILAEFDHAGACQQAALRGVLLLPGRFGQQHGQFTDDRCRQNGHGCAPGRSQSLLASS